MSMEIIQSAATELLVNVALAVLALAGAYAVYYIRLGTSKLKAQTAQIEDASTRKVLDDALEDVANLATLSVGAMEQTTAKALREAVKGGKASREELVALGKQVFDEVKASIAPEAQRECRQLDSQLPALEQSERQAAGADLAEVQRRLFGLRSRYRDLGC